MTLDDLRNLLTAVPAGRLIDPTAAEVKSMLIACWGGLAGSGDEGTTSDKLSGRIELLEWTPPNLTFRIERHGGTVQGSTRADLHRWTVNVETGKASVERGRYRQLTPREPTMKLDPICAELVLAIVEATKVRTLLRVRKSMSSRRLLRRSILASKLLTVRRQSKIADGAGHGPLRCVCSRAL